MSTSSDRAAIRRLRRGVAASSHVGYLAVGLDEQSVVFKRLFEALRRGMSGSCFVEGEWGTGKSCLLALARQLAIDSRCAVAYLNLNGRSAALNRPQRFYHLIATGLRLGNGSAGLSGLIERSIHGPALQERLKTWAEVRRGQSEFASALLGALGESGGVWSWSVNHAWSVLTGTDLAWADYGYKREKRSSA